MSKPHVICIGEALIDRIVNKSDLNYKDYLGGAPANVACALTKLKVSTAFIGCIGNDNYGDDFAKLFNKLNINTNFVQTDINSSTRIVNVIRDINGDRSFAGFENYLNNNFSDEMLDKCSLKQNIFDLKKLLAKTNFIVTGTNILISEKSSESLYFILECAKNFDISIVIDANWRDIFWNNSSALKKDKQSNFKKVKNLLQHADILKLSNEEANLFFEVNDPYVISSVLPKKPNVIITDGPNPIRWFINGLTGENNVFNSEKIVDTTGAGDAFLAGLISRFCEDLNPSDESTIKKNNKFC